MKITYLFSFLSLAVLAACAFALTGAKSVNAASIYDGAIRTTPQLSIINNDGSHNIDIGDPESAYYYQDLLSTCTGFTSALSTGSVTISQQLATLSTEETYGDVGVFAYWDNSPQSYTPSNFVSAGSGEYGLSAPTFDHFAYIRVRANGTVDTLCESGFLSFFASTSGQIDSIYNNFEAYIFYTTYSVTYPTGYEGTLIPSEPPTTEVPLSYIVNFTLSNTKTYATAEFSSKETDPVSNLKDPKRIWWRLYDSTDPLESELLYGDSLCDVDIPIKTPFNTTTHCPEFEVDTTRQYTLVATVNPINNENIDQTGYEITWKQTSYLIDFSKSSAGSTENCEPGATYGDINHLNCIAPEDLQFVNCFIETFPFIELNECLNNMELLVNLLSFKSISYANDWSPTVECHDLATLGDWLPLDNTTVCPQIPSFIRLITTPFVTFLLGLLTIKFLTSREGYLQ